jgi:hypothetical protein
VVCSTVSVVATVVPGAVVVSGTVGTQISVSVVTTSAAPPTSSPLQQSGREQRRENNQPLHAR